jgi:hypothetical protein
MGVVEAVGEAAEAVVEASNRVMTTNHSINPSNLATTPSLLKDIKVRNGHLWVVANLLTRVSNPSFSRPCPLLNMHIPSRCRAPLKIILLLAAMKPLPLAMHLLSPWNIASQLLALSLWKLLLLALLQWNQ